jgi:hypothetical protein
MFGITVGWFLGLFPALILGLSGCVLGTFSFLTRSIRKPARRYNTRWVLWGFVASTASVALVVGTWVYYEYLWRT